MKRLFVHSRRRGVHKSHNYRTNTFPRTQAHKAIQASKPAQQLPQDTDCDTMSNQLPKDMPRVVPALGMTTDEFRKRGKEVIDIIADYYDNIESYRVRSAVEPGYLVNALPGEAPNDPESWDSIISDLHKHILPGVTHFQSPKFYAYFPANTSYPSLIGDLLSGTFNMIGFNWINGPALTELENVTMNWLRKMLDLPEFFQDNGVIQSTASDGTLVTVLSARDQALRNSADSNILQLVGYCSSQSHGSVQKAFKLAGIASDQIRSIPVADSGPEMGRLDPVLLKQAMEEDAANGLVPFFVVCTIGTTGISAADDLEHIGKLCDKHGSWMHVDAAYAGTALICEEFRKFAHGMDRASSFLFNPHKWMLVNFDCSVLFVKDRPALLSAMGSGMAIYDNEVSRSGRVVDYKDWQIPLGRRFRALKLWMVLRTYGVKGIQAHVRRHVHQAKYFESLVQNDPRLAMFCPRDFSLVCFQVRIPGKSTTAENFSEDELRLSNQLQGSVVDYLNEKGDIFITPSAMNGQSYLRFVICSTMSEMHHVEFAWKCISEAVDHAIDTCS